MSWEITGTLEKAQVISAEVGIYPWVFRESIVYSWDGLSTQPLWVQTLPNDTIVGNKLITFSAGNVITFAQVGKANNFVAINPKDGNIIWNSTFDISTSNIKADSANIYALGISKGHQALLSIDSSQGEIKEIIPIKGVYMAISHRYIFVGDKYNGLKVVPVNDLKRVENVFRESIHSITVDQDEVYVVCQKFNNNNETHIRVLDSESAQQIEDIVIPDQGIQLYLSGNENKKIIVTSKDVGIIRIIDMKRKTIVLEKMIEPGYYVYNLVWTPYGIIALSRPGNNVSQTKVISLNESSALATLIPSQISCSHIFWTGSHLLLKGAKGLESYTWMSDKDDRS